MSEQRNQGGVDKQSSLADIKDALSRLGAEIETDETDGEWTASVKAGGVTGHGETDQAAAYDLWSRYVAEQGGTGTS
jgi:hypothetical protein